MTPHTATRPWPRSGSDGRRRRRPGGGIRLNSVKGSAIRRICPDTARITAFLEIVRILQVITECFREVTEMRMNLRKLAATGIGIALFAVLSLCVQVPVFQNYYLCLGYVAVACYCYSFGALSGTAVGALGVVLYCLLTSGLRGMPGWALGNVVIGAGLGLTFRSSKAIPSGKLRYALWAGAAVLFTAVGILGVKSLIDSLIKSQPFLLRAGMNVYAFIADAAVLILALPLCPMLDRPARKLI